ncbi:MAG: hypothetical protein HYR72_10690 [Deltaproteobacteria bacterium]|nr:hypothetical protein [Deltaproteobacteria bacterium]
MPQDGVTVYEGSALTRANFAEFLVQAYMGSGDRLGKGLRWSRYLWRAYLDFNRTLHGFRGCEDKADRLHSSAAWIEDRIIHLGASPPTAESVFDDWHLETRRGVEDRMGSWGKSQTMRPGQSQKWVNMSLKYIYTASALGVAEDFAVAASGYKYAHLPLDKSVLAELSRKGCDLAGKWIVRWSSLDEAAYDSIQVWSREYLANGKSLLDLDWSLWNRSGVSNYEDHEAVRGVPIAGRVR